MAEFIGTRVDPAPYTGGNDGFAAMGKPVPPHRKAEAMKHCKAMGLTHNTEQLMTLIDGMSNKLERDDPYEAMRIGMKYLDLTGTYRLMAVLLCDPPKPKRKPRRNMKEMG